MGNALSMGIASSSGNIRWMSYAQMLRSGIGATPARHQNFPLADAVRR